MYLINVTALPGDPREQPSSRGDEETRTLKRKLFLSVLALIPALLMAPALKAQIAPDRGTPVEHPPVSKYTAYAGFGYTSLNQVNQSRYGLVGFNLDVSRNLGRFFSIAADGAYYGWALRSGNPGKPTVSQVLFGPELHAPLYGPINGFVRGWLGGVHTGGTGQTPNISFAGGPGGGLEWVLNPRWTVRASGDYIGSAFSVTNNTPQLGYSPHTRFNARAGVGAVYHF